MAANHAPMKRIITISAITTKYSFGLIEPPVPDQRIWAGGGTSDRSKHHAIARSPLPWNTLANFSTECLLWPELADISELREIHPPRITARTGRHSNEGSEFIANADHGAAPDQKITHLATFFYIHIYILGKKLQTFQIIPRPSPLYEYRDDTALWRRPLLHTQHLNNSPSYFHSAYFPFFR